MNTEKQDKHLEALKEKHHSLDLLIEEEMSHPAPNDSLIQQWKKEKLKLKEEITEIESKK